MNTRTYCRRFSLSLCSAVLILLPLSQAYAGSQELFNKLMDTYINATPAKIFETQQRGGITLGSVSTRSRIVRPKLISIVPPSIHGDCNGIDATGGSFSFINGEQLQQFLRAIASNALNYAFTLALEGVCPSCMQQMAQLRDWAAEMNKNMMDSCYWAKKMVDATGLKEWHQSRMEEAKNNGVQKGLFGDSFLGRLNFISELTTDTDLDEPSSVNAVWDAMRRSQTGSWFGAFGDNEMLEVLMSVTGTMIKTPQDVDGAPCTNAELKDEYCFQELVPILDIEHFIDGTNGGPVNVYHCADSFSDCVFVQQQERAWPGLKDRIRDILFGPPPGFNGGLVTKLRDPLGGGYTEAERRFMEGAPIPIFPLLKSAAKYEGQLITMGQQIQEMIVAQIARNLVLELITTVKKSFGAHGVQMSSMMQDKLHDRVAEFGVRATVGDKDFDRMFMLIEAREMLDRSNSSQSTTQDNIDPAPPNKM